MLEAQVEWTRLEPDYQRLYQVDSSSHFNVPTSKCFECGCMVDLIASKRGWHIILLNRINESAKYISLTATGYYLPEIHDAFITSLKCIGIRNWFLSVLWIRNVSESDVGSYGVTVCSTRSMLLNHTLSRNFTLTTGKHPRWESEVNACYTRTSTKLELNAMHACTHLIGYIQIEPMFKGQQPNHRVHYWGEYCLLHLQRHNSSHLLSSVEKRGQWNSANYEAYGITKLYCTWCERHVSNLCTRTA